MAPDDPNEELRELWQGQRAQDERPSLDRVRRLAQRMESRIQWRNIREYAAALLLIILVAPTMWSDTSVLVRIGAGLLIAASLYVVHHLHARGSVRQMPAGMALASCVEFHRDELVRQRELLRSIWSWYLLPFVPGVAFVLIGRAIEHPERWPFIAAAAAIVALVFLGVAWLNARAARAVERRIEELERVR